MITHGLTLSEGNFETASIASMRHVRLWLSSLSRTVHPMSDDQFVEATLAHKASLKLFLSSALSSRSIDIALAQSASTWRQKGRTGPDSD